MAEPEVFLRLRMNKYVLVGIVRLIEVTHSFLLRDAHLDSGVSILDFGMARNFAWFWDQEQVTVKT